MKNWKLACLALVALPVMGFAATQAGAPAGFNYNDSWGAPKGFEPAKMTVEQVKKNASDEQMVVLEGAFTAHLRGDKFEFTDRAGQTITAELDNDQNWSMVERGKPVMIRAEVDRDWNSIELEVREVRPLK